MSPDKMLGALSGGILGGLLMPSTPEAPAAPTAPAAPPQTQQPIGQKPKSKSTQPSFLAGASMLPGAGAGPSGGGGKSLLGQ